MKFRILIPLMFVALSLLLCSCEKEPDAVTPSQWITVPEYDFPIFVARRGGVVTTSQVTFDVTGFIEVGDSTAYGDSLEWKVLPYTRAKTRNQEPQIERQLSSGLENGDQR